MFTYAVFKLLLGRWELVQAVEEIVMQMVLYVNVGRDGRWTKRVWFGQNKRKITRN